jgi:signal transduction histidine kinase
MGDGDARASLDATLALLEDETRARRVTVTRAREWPAVAPVGLDPDGLKQIFLNLLLNALEAMEGGGTIEVSLAETRGRVEIVFRDSGPGIAPDTLRRMGEPFVTSKAQGTGLGVFLTRRLAESAGGTLEVGNAPGGGAQARVSLPRRRV